MADIILGHNLPIWVNNVTANKSLERKIFEGRKGVSRSRAERDSMAKKKLNGMAEQMRVTAKITRRMGGG